MEETQEKVRKTAQEQDLEVERSVFDDASGKVIDIDSILEMDEPVIHKLKKLTRFGVSIDQIKELYGTSSNLTGGEALQIAWSELDNIYNILVDTINKLPNGIMIEVETGDLDFKATLEHRQNLGLDEKIEVVRSKYDSYTISDFFDVITSKNPLDELDPDDYKKIEDELKSFIYSNKDWDNDFYHKLGMDDKEINEIKDQEEYTRINNNNQVDFLDALYEFKAHADNPDSEEYQKAFDKLKNCALLCNRTEWTDKIYDNNGEIDPKKAIDFLEDFEHERNEADIVKDLKNFLKMDISKLDENGKEDLLKILYLALDHKEDYPELVKMTQKAAKELGLKEVSKESLKHEVEKLLGIEYSDENFKKVAEAKLFSSKTYKTKLKRIRRSINRNENKEMTAEEVEREDEINSARRSNVFKELDNYMEKCVDNGKDFRGHAIFQLYKEYQEEMEKLSDSNDKKERLEEDLDVLDAYIKKNKKFFSAYFAKYYNREIFDDEGNVNYSEAFEVLDMSKMPDNLKNNIRGVKGNITRVHTACDKVIDIQKHQKNLNKLNKYINDDMEMTSNKKKAILDLINKIGIKNLGTEELNKLASMDPEIKKTIEDGLSNQYKSKELWISSKTEEEFIIEKIIELEYQASTLKNTEKRRIVGRNLDQLYEKYPKVKDKIERMKQTTVETNEGKENEYELKQNEVLDNIINKTVKRNMRRNANIKNLSEEEKKAYLTWLAVGMNASDYEIQLDAVEQIKILYPELNNEKSYLDFQMKLMKIIDPKIKTTDAMLDKIDELKENLLENVLNQKKFTNEKINDDNLDQYFEKNAVEMDSTAINLTKKPIQRYFEGSAFEYTQKDVEQFEEFYSSAKINSWLSDKKTVVQYEYLSLLSLIEREKNNETSKTIDKYENSYKDMMEELKQKYSPYIEELYDDKGKIKKEFVEEAKQYRTNKKVASTLKYFGSDDDLQKKYSELSTSEKKKMMRYTLLALQGANKAKNQNQKDVFLKLYYRNLELMNEDDKEIITIRKSSVVKIDEKALLDKYNELMDNKYAVKSLDEAMEITDLRMDNYTVVGKLHRYQRQQEEDFIHLEDGTNEEKMLQMTLFSIKQNKKYNEQRKAIREKLVRTEQQEIKTEKRKSSVQIDSEENKDAKFLKERIEPENLDASATTLEVKENLWDKIKGLFDRFSVKKIGDGSKENKKEGFFSKLFGKKEEPKVEVSEENNKEEKAIQDGLSHVKLDNSDGKYNISTSGENKSQYEGKVSNQQEHEEYGELG